MKMKNKKVSLRIRIDDDTDRRIQEGKKGEKIVDFWNEKVVKRRRSCCNYIVGREMVN